MDFLSADTALWALRNLGPLGAFIVVFLIWIKTDQSRWNDRRVDDLALREAERKERDIERTNQKIDRIAEREERERDRREHMAKWESITHSHNTEIERAYKLLDRQTQANEMQAHLMSILNQKIDNNQFCPVVRKETGGNVTK